MTGKPKVLCVDDEPKVLEGLELVLRRQFEVVAAVGAKPAIAILERDQSFAVIISDMRMPMMDGATFLARARKLCPDAVRVLLTGHSDPQSIIAAVNEAGVFRFLTKPCAPNELNAVLAEALEQHETVTAERVLLEQTLRGSVQTIMDVLAMIQPMTFGRATRIATLVSKIADILGVKERWALELAALLSQLGTIILTKEVSEKLYHGDTLTTEEQAMVDRTPAITDQLIGHIPRLQLVRAVLATHARIGKADPSLTEAERRMVLRSAQILGVVTDFVRYEGRGLDIAIDMLRGQSERYEPDVLQALLSLHGVGEGREIRELPLAALRAGMVILDELRTVTNVLLCPGGYEVTKTFVERARNFRLGSVREPIRVSVPVSVDPEKAAAAGAPAPAATAAPAKA